MTSILDIVAESRAAFERERDERKWSLIARRAWREGIPRLAAYHQAVTRRYLRRFGETARWQPAIDETHWGADFLALDATGRPLSNVSNITLCLRNHAALSGILARDLSSNQVMLKGPLPHDFWESFSFEMRKVGYDDVTQIQVFLQELGLVDITREDVAAAIKVIARENAWQGERP